jgi:transcriptional regulator with XRE-family HTH domain
VHCQRGTGRAPHAGRARSTVNFEPIEEDQYRGRRYDIAEFLTTRRAKITPEQAGLPSYGTRRVPGLRREEVASLAGMSVDYYKRLQRGNVSGVSELVLEGLARALRLDDAERAHLFDLARAANPVVPRRTRPVKQKLRPVVQQILNQITAPATVRNARLDYVGANALGRALYAPVFDSRERPVNSARFTFLDPAAADFYPEWDKVASELVAHLRSEAGRNPYDRQLTDLIGELSTRSDEFRVSWAAHNVRFHRTGTKHILHPIVGELQLSYESLDVSADNGLSVAIFTAEPGSASQQALDLLASWTATPDPTEDRLRGAPREP